jgi:hypothetical protein
VIEDESIAGEPKHHRTCRRELIPRATTIRHEYLWV